MIKRVVCGVVAALLLCGTGFAARADGARLVTEFVFDDMLAPSGGFAAVRVGERWGFVDVRDGELVIPAEYAEVRSFGAFGAVRGDNGLWALIDRSGVVAGEFAYSEPSSGFQGGRVVANGSTGRCAFVLDGALLSGFDYEDIRMGASGLHAIKQHGKWGFADDHAETVIALQYDEVGDFSGGIAAAKMGGKWGIINRSGVALVAFEWDWARVNGGNASLKGGGRVAVCDARGAVKSSNHWRDIGVFSGGLCAVDVNGRWGFVDNMGELVETARFDSVGDGFDGSFPVKIRGGYGYTVGGGAYTIAGAVDMCRKYNGFAVYRLAGGHAFVYGDGSTWGGSLGEVRVSDDGASAAVSLRGKWALYHTSANKPEGGFVPVTATGNGSAWAQKELERAAALGLTVTLSTDGDWTRDITREEFCGLVVTLYDLMGGQYPDVIHNKFTDTDSLAVIKAAGVGIVNGRSADRFAPNEAVTRQDLCVMLDRMLSALGVELDEHNSGEPSDMAVVSDYAAAAVARLYRASIVSGSVKQGRVVVEPHAHASVEQAVLLLLRCVE